MQMFERLERDLASWIGVEPGNAVVCSSGTAALHLALESLNLPSGSEVIVPDYAMIACPRAVVLAGLTPVFVDCRDDLLIDPDWIDEAASRCKNVRAVMPVHIYGRRCDMDAIALLARKHQLHVVEDMAEAHGVPVHPESDAACYSFYKNKIVAGEEGGCVAYPGISECPASRAYLARQLRSLGFTDQHDFNHIPRGHNYRLANVLANPILASLKNVNENLQIRRRIEQWYDVPCEPAWRMSPRNKVWVYDLRIPGMTQVQQNSLVAALQAAGVAARHGFKPMSRQREFQQCRVFGNNVAACLASEIVYLPVVPGVTTPEDVTRAFEVINRHIATETESNAV